MSCKSNGARFQWWSVFAEEAAVLLRHCVNAINLECGVGKNGCGVDRPVSDQFFDSISHRLILNQNLALVVAKNWRD